MNSETRHTDRVSYKKKKANDFRWVEEQADYWDTFLTNPEDDKLQEKYSLNADLYNSRYPNHHRMRASMAETSADIGTESIDFENASESIKHYNILSHIAKSLVGEQQKRPWKPISVDKSIYGYNQRKQEITKRTQNWLQESIINPIRKEAAQGYMQDNGIEDIFKLEPEQQQQAQQEIEQRFQSMSPTETMRYMRKEYKSPMEKMGKEVLSVINEDHDLKYMTDEGFKNLVVFGRQVYYANSIDGRCITEPVDIPGFKNHTIGTKFFIEESEACVYRRQKLFSDIFYEHGAELSRPKYKEALDSIVLGATTKNKREPGEPNARMVTEIAANPDKYGVRDVDIRTIEGQRKLAYMYSSSVAAQTSNYAVETVHICFRTLRLFKRVLRVMPNGELKRFWLDESYILDPLKGDVEVTNYWLPVIYECEKLGYGGDAIYLNKRRVPWQYKNFDDPYNTLMPYIGVDYSTLMGNTKNVSPIDAGKPWQDKFDIQIAKMEELDQNNWGQIFAMGQSMKPKDITWTDWFKMMRYGKVALLDELQPHQAQLIKTLDMSTANEIGNKLQFLEHIYQMASRAMSYNPSRLGEVSPYMTVTNNQQNIIQSAHQTENIFTLHNKCVERYLNALMRVKIHALRNNPTEQTYTLSDMSVGLLKAEPYLLDLAKFQVKLSLDPADYEKLLEVKRDLPAMAGAGVIEYDEYIRSKWAETGEELLNIAEESKERKERQQEADRQSQLEAIEKQKEMQEQLFNMQAELDLLKQSRELAVKRYMAEMDSEKFANQFDINNNNINDSYEKEIKKIEADLKKHNDEMELKMKELRNDMQKHKEALAVEKEKVRKMSNKSSIKK